MERYTGCNFSVHIAPIEIVGNFSQVSGLSAEMEYDIYNEGGNFTSPVLMPRGMKYSNIVLQRGTISMEPLTLWFDSVMLGAHIRYPMVVMMYNNQRIPVKIWTVMDAIPVKIEWSTMDAMSDQVAVTSVELAHGPIVAVL